jgi:hypothetical protein
MATVKYKTPAGEIDFTYPILTISRTALRSETKKAIVAIRHVYTVRSIIMATPSETLDNAITRYRTILMDVGGELTIRDPQFAADILISPETDIDQGPTPEAFEIERIHGGKSLILIWQIGTVEFPGKWLGAEADKWIDSVYTMRTEIDSAFYASRTISGFLKLNPGHADFKNRTADAYRDTIYNKFPIPTLPHGMWQRTNSTWAISEDGATLGFSLTDEQVYSYLPEGCTDGNIVIETSSKADGSGYCNFNGWFVGSANRSRGEIQGICFEMMESFANMALTMMYENSGQELYIKEEESRYVHNLRSNRVDFQMSHSIYGLTNGMTTASKLEFIAGIASNWLAVQTGLLFRSPAVDEGPYGSARLCGLTEKIAPVIMVDWDDKHILPPVPVTPGNPPSTGGNAVSPVGATPATNKHVLFRQTYRFIVKPHIVSMSLPAANTLYSGLVINTRPAEVFLLVQGEAERLDPQLRIPIPPFPLITSLGLVSRNTPCAMQIAWEVTPEAPRVDGTFRITWNYILQLFNMETYIFNGALNYVPWPYTPLLPEGDGLTWNWEQHWTRPAITETYPLIGETWR